MKTIKDIAKELGIAPSTVSRVLNKSGYYSKEVAEKVNKYVEETGFVYNKAARQLKNAKSYTIGLVIPNISNEFFSKMALIVDGYFYKLGYSIIIFNTASNPDRELAAIKQLASSKVDGILFVGAGSKLDKSLMQWNIPVVTLDRPFRGTLPVTHILSNEYNLGAIAAQCLLDAGCKKIKFVYKSHPSNYTTLNNNDFTMSGRISGFIDTLGIPHNSEEIKKYSIIIPDFNKPSAEEAELFFDFLDKQIIDYDGLFCLWDKLAYGVSKSLTKKGIKIPEDIKIVGFDNGVYSALSTPSITTLDRNLDLMAKIACDKLLEKMNSDNKFLEEKIEIKGSLIKRESC